MKNKRNNGPTAGLKSRSRPQVKRTGVGNTGVPKTTVTPNGTFGVYRLGRDPGAGGGSKVGEKGQKARRFTTFSGSYYSRCQVVFYSPVVGTSKVRANITTALGTC